MSEAISNKKRKPSPKTEKEFLALKAENAKAAFSRKVRETSGHVFSLVDPSSVVRRHPLSSTGLAVFGGFLLGVREKSPEPAPASPASETDPAESAASTPSLWGVVLGTGFEIVKNALVPVLTEKLGEKIKG